MLPVLGGAIFGYGLATKRRGLMAVGGLLVIGSFVLLGVAIARQRAEGAK